MKKTFLTAPALLLTIFSLAFFLPQAAQGAVTFTLTPSTISNGYTGALTLQISGLTNNEPVVVQKYLDVNGNGVVDSKDWLVQQFNLTDGRAGSVIGGVTNINIPGDSTGADGAITAKVTPLLGGVEQRFVGQYLWVVSSPFGRWTALTYTNHVTNSAYSQSITGNIQCSGTNVPYAMLLVGIPGGDGLNPQWGTVANASGAYSIAVPSGSYGLYPLASNFLSSSSDEPVVTVGSTTLNTNLTLLGGAVNFISGRLVDSTNSNLGLPGCLTMFQEASGGNSAFGTTDTNGNFKVWVNAAQFKIGFESQAFDVHGYLKPSDKVTVDASTGSVTSVTITSARGTALIYGTVKDNNNNPLVGVRIDGDVSNGGGGGDNSGAGDATSDANGDYSMAVTNGSWDASFNSSSPPAFTNYLFSQTSYSFNNGGNGTNINTGAATQINLTALLATNHITGFLKDGNGDGISGINIYASATINNTNYNANADTASDGSYSLNVGGNSVDWNVGVNYCSSGDCGNGLGPPYIQPNNLNITINNNNTNNVNFTAAIGFLISGQVLDNNSNPISNLGICANDTNGDMFCGGTDQNGNYSIGVTNGDWTLNLDCNGLQNMGYQCPANQDVPVSGANVDGVNFAVYPCSSLGITTSSSLPSGTVGQYYSLVFSNSGCASPFTWSILSGSTDGLNLDGYGNFTGTPTNPGVYNFYVEVTDNNENIVTQEMSITISAGALQVTTTGLPSGNENQFYSQQLQASGGVPPYSWAYTAGSPTLPSSLPLGTNGLISGTPTVSGSFEFLVTVTDNVGATAGSDTLSIYIAAPPLVITTASLSNATVTAYYSNQLAATGGVPPYNWSLYGVSLPLPTGLSLSSSGVISGAPVNSGLSNFIVQVSDQNFTQVHKSLGINIFPLPSLSSPNRLSSTQFRMTLNGSPGQNYTVQYTTNWMAWSNAFVTNPISSSVSITDTNNVTNRYRFYRLLIGP